MSFFSDKLQTFFKRVFSYLSLFPEKNMHRMNVCRLLLKKTL